MGKKSRNRANRKPRLPPVELSKEDLEAINAWMALRENLMKILPPTLRKKAQEFPYDPEVQEEVTLVATAMGVLDMGPAKLEEHRQMFSKVATIMKKTEERKN